MSHPRQVTAFAAKSLRCLPFSPPHPKVRCPLKKLRIHRSSIVGVPSTVGAPRPASFPSRPSRMPPSFTRRQPHWHPASARHAAAGRRGASDCERHYQAAYANLDLSRASFVCAFVSGSPPPSPSLVFVPFTRSPSEHVVPPR